MAVYSTAKLRSTEFINTSTMRVVIESNRISHIIKPGQFIMLSLKRDGLMQPFSIAHIQPPYLILYIQIKGDGTRALSNISEGKELRMLAPLGRSWQDCIGDRYNHKLLLVAGGFGFPPLISILGHVDPKRVCFFYGVKTSTHQLNLPILGLKEKYIATEDGSLGYKGSVVDLLINWYRSNKGDYTVLSCGPFNMLKALHNDFLFPNKIKGYISLEARMACGLGVCQGCVIKTHDKDMPYMRVCKEGAIFDASIIDWSVAPLR